MSNRSPNLKALKQTAWFAAILVLVSTCIFGLFVGAGSWMTRNAGKLSDEAKVQRTRDLALKPRTIDPSTIPVKDIYTNEFLPKLFPTRGQ